MDFKLVVKTQDNSKVYTLDLYGDIDMNIIFNINDIRNPESVKSNYTKPITIPATHNNNSFFESLIYNGNYPTNFDPNFKVSAQLYGDDEILIDGFIQVLKINKIDDNLDSYDIVILGEISNLFNLLTNLKLSDLDLSEYNHIWNYTNIVNSWDKSIKYNGNDAPFILGRGYVYPFEWRGQTTNEMKVEDFLPSIYFKTIFDKIFKKAGKTYTSEFLNTDEFKGLILPFSKERILLSEDEKNKSEFEVKQSVDINLKDSSNNNVIMFPTIATTTQDSNLSFDTEISDVGNLFTVNTFTANKKMLTSIGANIEIKIAFQANISFGSQWRIVGDPIKANVTLYNVTQNKPLASEIIDINYPTGVLVGSLPYFASAKSFVDYSGLIDNGDKIQVRVNITVPPSSFPSKFMTVLGQPVGGTITPFLVQNSNFYNAIVENYLFEGDLVDMNQVLPSDLTINDFLLNVNKMFNLYWSPDGDNNFIIEPRDKIYSKPNLKILDWTDKTNEDSEINIIPLHELNNKNYLFTYSDGDDYYNDTYTSNYNEIYGQKDISVVNDFVTDEKEIKLIFQPSILVKMNSSERIAPAYVIQENGFFESTEPKLRVNYYGGLITTNDYFLFKSKDYPNGLMKYSYPYAGHFDNPSSPKLDINFGTTKQYYYPNSVKTTNNLFNKYWINTISDIISPDSHLWVGELHLKPFDIITLNLFDTIQMYNVYYKINKIDYNPLTELAKVELIKTNTFLQKPNVTTLQPFLDLELIEGFGPSIWGLDNTYVGGFISPFQNGQWLDSISGMRLESESETGTFVNNNVLVQTNNQVYTSTDIDLSVHDNIYKTTNFVSVGGVGNFVATDAYGVSVIGNSNVVLGGTSNISVLGNNNVVNAGLTNVSIVGDGIIATLSNVSYVNDSVIQNNTLTSSYNFLNGSVNSVQNNFNSTVVANMVVGGKNTVQAIGGDGNINYVNGGINSSLFP